MYFNTEKEVWKDIEGFEGVYQVSSIGRIKRLAGISVINGRKYTVKKDRFLKPEKMGKGYLRAQLTATPKQRRVLVHTLVAETFLGIPEESYLQINHKNGIKDDNRVENLEWVTGSENVKHAFETGLNERQVGESNGSSILKEKDVKLILRLSSFNKLTHEEMSRVFGVSKSTITAIISGRNWGYLKNN